MWDSVSGKWMYSYKVSTDVFPGTSATSNCVTLTFKNTRNIDNRGRFTVSRCDIYVTCDLLSMRNKMYFQQTLV